MVENQQPQSTPPNLSLIYTGCERLNPKNFREEVRAQLDVEVFVNQAHLILDADDKLELKQLVSYMLERVIIAKISSLRFLVSEISYQV